MKTNETKEQARFLMNEIVYLNPELNSEKIQGREFTSQLCDITESLEVSNASQSFIDLCWNRITLGITKFR